MTIELAAMQEGVYNEIGSSDMFDETSVKNALNTAINRTDYLFREKKDESQTTAASTYAYTVHADMVGEPLEIWLEINTDDADAPYARLMNWIYSEADKKVLFGYQLPTGRTLRMIGPQRLSVLITEASETETEESNVSHLYALALSHLFQQKMAQASGTEQEQWDRDRKLWLRIAEERGMNVELLLPLPTDKIPGWCF